MRRWFIRFLLCAAGLSVGLQFANAEGRPQTNQAGVSQQRDGLVAGRAGIPPSVSTPVGTWPPAEQQTYAPKTSPTVQDSEPPQSISIPRLGIKNVRLSLAWTDLDGRLKVTADEIGWYEYSSELGSAGSTLIAAHVTWDREDGPFRYLSELEVGDAIHVVGSTNKDHEYVVTTRSIYDRAQLPLAEIDAGAGSENQLVLVTCGGEFNYDSGRYQSNVVVVAERAD